MPCSRTTSSQRQKGRLAAPLAPVVASGAKERDDDNERDGSAPMCTLGHRWTASPKDRPLENPKSDNDSEQIRFTISFARLLSIIQSLSGFEWPLPLRGDPEGRDKSRFFEYHIDVGHWTNSYFRIRCLLNYLVSKGHL